MTILTFESAAAAAMDEIDTMFLHRHGVVNIDLSDHMQFLIEAIESDPPFEGILRDDYKFLAIAALRLIQMYEEDTGDEVDDPFDLLVSKQRDYGHSNILRFGHDGLRVRLWDKVARYEHLTGRTLRPSNESLADTLVDIYNYCTIGLMLLDDTFALPLDEDIDR